MAAKRGRQNIKKNLTCITNQGKITSPLSQSEFLQKNSQVFSFLAFSYFWTENAGKKT